MLRKERRCWRILNRLRIYLINFFYRLKRNNSKAIIFGVVGEGIAVLKKLIPETKTIVIMPPTTKEQIERLRRRGTENDAQILQRVERDKILFANYKDMYDYVVVSEDGDVYSVVRELSEIIKK